MKPAILFIVCIRLHNLNKNNYEYILCSQFIPEYPATHVQVYSLTPSTHCPPFWQGLLPHSSTSETGKQHLCHSLLDYHLKTFETREVIQRIILYLKLCTMSNIFFHILNFGV